MTVESRGTIWQPTIILGGDELILHETSRIDPYCLIDANGGAIVESESVIHAGSHIIGGGEFKMGPRSVITYNCAILTSTADLRYPASSVVPGDQRKTIMDDVILKQETFVGSGSVIMPGVTLNEGSCVAANSYVDEDVPPWTIRFPDGSERNREKAESAPF